MSQTLKSRIAVIILMTLLLSLISTICCAAEATETIKAKLNTKIYFEGDTHQFHSGRLAKKVRKSYKDGKLGCARRMQAAFMHWMRLSTLPTERISSIRCPTSPRPMPCFSFRT